MEQLPKIENVNIYSFMITFQPVWLFSPSEIYVKMPIILISQSVFSWHVMDKKKYQNVFFYIPQKLCKWWQNFNFSLIFMVMQ